MSLRRTCDCPETYCHISDDYYMGYDESIFLGAENYETIGGRDICLTCLDRCHYWQPYAIEDKFLPEEPQITSLVRDVYERVIQESLKQESSVIFKIMKENLNGKEI